MTWSPDPTAPRDVRFDRYRNRVAGLSRGADVLGHVIFLTEVSSMLLGGHLWWRRWSLPLEVMAPRIQLADGRSSEPSMEESDIEEELELWGKDQFALGDQVLGLSWLTSEEALAVVPAVFGLDGCFDNDGRPMWTFPTPADP